MWIAAETYYDKKIMQARIQTGEKIENDRFTMDIGRDTARGVVLGDRQTYPRIEEGGSILYNPHDSQGFVRVYR